VADAARPLSFEAGEHPWPLSSTGRRTRAAAKADEIKVADLKIAARLAADLSVDDRGLMGER
jgi:hypothetical protein